MIEAVKNESKLNNIKRTCQLLSIPRSSYYEKLCRKPSKRDQENQKLDQLIRKELYNSRQIYGASRIHHLVKKKFGYLNLKRVQRRMSLMGLRSKITKNGAQLLIKKTRIEEKENLINQDFTTTGLNQKWVTDIAYINTQKDGWCYLSSIMDLYSRKIIAWNLGKKMDRSLVIQTLKDAVKTHGKADNLIIHSDLGNQYTSSDYEECLKSLKIKHSFSHKGCPYDNACIESFHSILKKEEIYQSRYQDYDNAKNRLFIYIENFYNRHRIHS